jgi:cysteine-rich repeat protein
MGCYNCTDTTVSYLIHSIEFKYGSFDIMEAPLSNNITNSKPFLMTIDYINFLCGDGTIDSGETWDDGNISSGDGCSSICEVEVGWGCSGSPSSCQEICGDGIKFNFDTSYCDDGDTTSGDGWSNSWVVEIGWTWGGGTTTTPDSWTIVCGDGILMPPTETWDDGNTGSNDGWSNLWQLEPYFDWTNNALNNPATNWVETCGDGIRLSSSGWDDGNNNNGDGWSSTCSVEPGWICFGGSSTISDSCQEICGDGIRFNSNSTYWDDGNAQDGDGCNSSCQVEHGYECYGGSTTNPDIWLVGWGDGVRYYADEAYWDDGNALDGDGCNSEWTIENGWEWTHTYGDQSVWAKIQVEEEESISDEAQTTQAITSAGAIFAAGTSVTNLSSPTGLWQSMNVMQLFMLILLFQIYVPSMIVEALNSTKYFSLAFEIPFVDKIPFISSTLDYLDFLPPKGHYDIMGVKSGSALVNIFCLSSILWFIWFLHILSYPLKLLGQKKSSGTKPSTWRLVCLKIWKIFTFGIYIRFALQSYQLLVLNFVSGLYNAQASDIPHFISVFSASVIGIFWITAPLLGLWIQLKRTGKGVEELFAGLKKNQASRIYHMMSMLRKLIFIMWMIIFNFLPRLPYLLVPSVYQLGHTSFIIAIRPFVKTKDNIIEIFNEITFTVILSGLNYLHSEENWRGQFINAYVYLIMAPGIFISIISLGKTLSKPPLKYYYRRNRYSDLQMLQIKKHQ